MIYMNIYMKYHLNADIIIIITLHLKYYAR